MALEKWKLDTAHSTVGFSIRHLMVSKVRGQFTRWTSTFEFDDEDPSRSRVEVAIDAASVDTKDEGRDTHLRSADFFDVANFPTIDFVAREISGQGDAIEMKGDLTIREITKPIVLEVEYLGRSKHAYLGERAGFSARTTINRKDFGIVFNQTLDTGGFALADKVDIELDVQAVLEVPLAQPQEATGA